MFHPDEDDVKIAVSPVVPPPTVLAGAQSADSGGAHGGVGAARSDDVPSVHVPMPSVRGGAEGLTLTFSNYSVPDAFTFVAKPQQSARLDMGAIPKSKLALRRLGDHNAPGLKEGEEPHVGRLRSATRRAQEKEMQKLQARGLVEGTDENDVEGLNPMREVFKDPAAVASKVHYPWAVWDLVTLQERCPAPDLNINTFTEYFLNALRAQEANWADTKVLLQKLLPPAKYRDIMALWDWGDDMLAVPTYPKRSDGTGNIAAGVAGDPARTEALVLDLKTMFPRKPPLQCLETCTFAKDDTAYTFMDKTREAFTQIMGAGAADNEAFRPFILSHYVTHLPSVVSQKIKATVGWESFSFATACTHAAHHLKDLGEEKEGKRERLLALQLLNLEPNSPECFQQTGQYRQVQQVQPQQVNGGQRGVGTGRRGGGRRRNGARNGGGSGNGNAPPLKQCSRCGGLGHFARFCMTVTSTPGQVTIGQPGLLPLGSPPPGQQLAIGPPSNTQGALNVYTHPFYQTSYVPQQTQQTFQTPGPQQLNQQFRTS